MGSRAVARVFSLTSTQLLSAMTLLDHEQRVPCMPCLWHIKAAEPIYRAEGHERLLLIVVYIY